MLTNKIKKIIKRNEFLKLIILKFYSKPLININNEQLEKRALLSYSIFHFKSQETLSHPNYVESRNLNKLLRENGYIVDVYNNIDDRKINYNKYDLIIGEGLPISNYFIKKNNKSKQIKTIYYGTGTHPFFQTEGSYRRGFEFYRKKGFFPKKSLRNLNEKWGVSASLSDNYIIIGNDFTKSTYEKYVQSDTIYTIKPPFYKTIDVNYSEKKKIKKFIWFGSYGLIHKGLDIVIETFIKRKDIELHVCGYLEEESEIIRAYSKELKESTNIYFYGFLSLNSSKFKELMSECMFSILISASEASATSVLTTMGNGGVIPLINKEIGIDLEYSIEVDKISVDALEKAIDKAINLSTSELEEKSKLVKLYVNDNFSENYFENRLKYIFKKIL